MPLRRKAGWYCKKWEFLQTPLHSHASSYCKTQEFLQAPLPNSYSYSYSCPYSYSYSYSYSCSCFYSYSPSHSHSYSYPRSYFCRGPLYVEPVSGVCEINAHRHSCQRASEPSSKLPTGRPASHRSPSARTPTPPRVNVGLSGNSTDQRPAPMTDVQRLANIDLHEGVGERLALGLHT